MLKFPYFPSFYVFPLCNWRFDALVFFSLVQYRSRGINEMILVHIGTSLGLFVYLRAFRLFRDQFAIDVDHLYWNVISIHLIYLIPV